MNIKSVGILGGTGGLGARMADYFSFNFPELKVLVSGRKTKLTNQHLVEQCDLVIFAVPIDKTLAVIKAMEPFARSNQIWADFTSIKQQPVEAMLKSKAQVCGLHPLFGPLPDIEGQTLIYCPGNLNDSSLKALLALLKGFKLMKFSPQEHDNLMGVVQCASHMSDMVMGQTLRKSGFDFETIWQVSSPSYRLKLEVMGRMFAQNPNLYADIATQNLSAPHFTALFTQAAVDLNKIVDECDRESLIKNFDQTANYLTTKFCNQAYADSQLFLSRYSAEEPISAKGETLASVAVFGEKNSHTDSASDDFLAFTKKGIKGFYGDIYQLVKAVDEGLVEWGIVPYENTTEGSVLEVLDELLSHKEVQIVASTQREIKQYAMACRPLALNEISSIYSHPQALSQSKAQLRKLNIMALLKAAGSTAQAAKQVKQNSAENWAAIGSKTLAQAMGLNIISSNLACANNKTRFVLLQKQGQAQQNTVTSFAFWFSADQAGNLATVLNYFSDQNINLLKLDSRRSSKDKGYYVFFVDAEVSLANFVKHQQVLKTEIAGIHVLGGY